MQKSRSARRPLTVTVLIHIAFVIGVGVAAAPFRHVGHALVKVGQRHRVLFVDVALHVCLQQWALIIWKGHGEEGFWITHKFVDISLSSHLRETWKKKPILMWDVGMVPKLRIVSVLQEIQISNHYILHWKLMQGCYVNYTSIKTHTHTNTTSSSPFPNGECRERNEQKTWFNAPERMDNKRKGNQVLTDTDREKKKNSSLCGINYSSSEGNAKC